MVTGMTLHPAPYLGFPFHQALLQHKGGLLDAVLELPRVNAAPTARAVVWRCGAVRSLPHDDLHALLCGFLQGGQLQVEWDVSGMTQACVHQPKIRAVYALH